MSSYDLIVLAVKLKGMSFPPWSGIVRSGRMSLSGRRDQDDGRREVRSTAKVHKIGGDEATLAAVSRCSQNIRQKAASGLTQA